MNKEKQLEQPNLNEKRKFGMRDCLAYASGDLGCNMSFALKSINHISSLQIVT